MIWIQQKRAIHLRINTTTSAHSDCLGVYLCLSGNFANVWLCECTWNQSNLVEFFILLGQIIVILIINTANVILFGLFSLFSCHFISLAFVGRFNCCLQIKIDHVENCRKKQFLKKPIRWKKKKGQYI